MKAAAAIFALPILLIAQSSTDPSRGYTHEPQPSDGSPVPSQALNRIHWSTPVDTNKPQGEIFIHYGVPILTPLDTALVPVKILQNGTDGFKVQAFAPNATGTSPAPLYELQTDYTLPPHAWTPPYGPVLSVRDRLYYAGAGGTVYYRNSVDSPRGAIGQIAFYGTAAYTSNPASYNATVFISTPLVADRFGDIFFGFEVTGANPSGLTSGIARIGADGSGMWTSARAAAGGDASITQVPLSSTPALSPTLIDNQRMLYFVVTAGMSGENTIGGYLVAVSSTTLAPVAHIALSDPSTANPATVSPDSSASPVVGPDGDVYFGVLESPCCTIHNSRGWMLHFNASLTQIKTPGSFGWDSTPSIVPSSLVPGYKGTSSYLILTKYNNYNGTGTGNGVNKVAVLDPNASMPDPIIGSVKVMNEVITVVGVGTPPVPEWCISTAAIDPFTKSALVSSEDGHTYRWDFTSNSLTQQIDLNPPIGEAYTPTLIGPDGTVYAINDAISMLSAGKRALWASFLWLAALAMAQQFEDPVTRLGRYTTSVRWRSGLSPFGSRRSPCPDRIPDRGLLQNQRAENADRSPASARSLLQRLGHRGLGSARVDRSGGARSATGNDLLHGGPEGMGTHDEIDVPLPTPHRLPQLPCFGGDARSARDIATQRLSLDRRCAARSAGRDRYRSANPIRKALGGWSVPGSSGSAHHMGNMTYNAPNQPGCPLPAAQNLQSYPASTSDIVALMVSNIRRT